MNTFLLRYPRKGSFGIKRRILKFTATEIEYKRPLTDSVTKYLNHLFRRPIFFWQPKIGLDWMKHDLIQWVNKSMLDFEQLASF